VVVPVLAPVVMTDDPAVDEALLLAAVLVADDELESEASGGEASRSCPPRDVTEASEQATAKSAR
jgi:hypothetical protein